METMKEDVLFILLEECKSSFQCLHGITVNDLPPFCRTANGIGYFEKKNR